MIKQRINDWEVECLPENVALAGAILSYTLEVVPNTKSPGFSLHFTGTVELELMRLKLVRVNPFEDYETEEWQEDYSDTLTLDVEYFSFEDCEDVITAQMYEPVLSIEFDEEKSVVCVKFEIR